MTKSKKINREEALDFLKQRIGGCFGSADGIFAGHASDEERAKELRKLAFKNSISLQEIKELALGYLRKSGFVEEHINEQLEKVTKMFGKKIQ